MKFRISKRFLMFFWKWWVCIPDSIVEAWLHLFLCFSLTWNLPMTLHYPFHSRLLACLCWHTWVLWISCTKNMLIWLLCAPSGDVYVHRHNFGCLKMVLALKKSQVWKKVISFSCLIFVFKSVQPTTFSSLVFPATSNPSWLYGLSISDWI